MLVKGEIKSDTRGRLAEEDGTELIRPRGIERLPEETKKAGIANGKELNKTGWKEWKREQYM
jgi:hypothetical protein